MHSFNYPYFWTIFFIGPAYGTPLTIHSLHPYYSKILINASLFVPPAVTNANATVTRSLGNPFHSHLARRSFTFDHHLDKYIRQRWTTLDGPHCFIYSIALLLDQNHPHCYFYLPWTNPSLTSRPVFVSRRRGLSAMVSQFYSFHLLQMKYLTFLADHKAQGRLTTLTQSIGRLETPPTAEAQAADQAKHQAKIASARGNTSLPGPLQPLTRNANNSGKDGEIKSDDDQDIEAGPALLGKYLRLSEFFFVHLPNCQISSWTILTTKTTASSGSIRSSRSSAIATTIATIPRTRTKNLCASCGRHFARAG